MRIKLRALIVRWLKVALAWLGEPGLVHPSVLALAREAVRAVNEAPHTGGYKHVLALKRLMATAPGVRRRDLRLAIELAVRELWP